MATSNIKKLIYYNATLNVVITVRVFENGQSDDVIISHIRFDNVSGVKIAEVYFPFKDGYLYTKTQILAFASSYGYTLTEYTSTTVTPTVLYTSKVATFHATNSSGGANLESVSITFNGETKLTSSAGLAVFNNVPAAVLTYTATKTSFVTQTAALTITVDVHTNLEMVAE